MKRDSSSSIAKTIFQSSRASVKNTSFGIHTFLAKNLLTKPSHVVMKSLHPRRESVSGVQASHCASMRTSQNALGSLRAKKARAIRRSLKNSLLSGFTKKRSVRACWVKERLLRRCPQLIIWPRLSVASFNRFSKSSVWDSVKPNKSLNLPSKVLLKVARWASSVSTRAWSMFSSI